MMSLSWFQRVRAVLDENGTQSMLMHTNPFPNLDPDKVETRSFKSHNKEITQLMYDAYWRKHIFGLAIGKDTTAHKS